jgi:hypothetical protein
MSNLSAFAQRVRHHSTQIVPAFQALQARRDGSRLLNGSYNWTRSASEVNEENLVVSSDPRLVAAFQGQFDRLWERLGAS